MHGRYNLKDKPRPDEELTLPGEYLDKLEKLACDKLTIWAQDGRLAKHKKLAGILYSWERWTKKEDVDHFVNELIKTDTGLIDFISSFLGKSTSHGMSDYVGRVHWKISLDSIKHFVDPTTFTDRARKIAQASDFNQLSEEKKKAVRIFLDTVF